MNRITCPVCGYDRLDKPPADFAICPCCGTEFGYDDYAASIEELRLRWIRSGAPWFSRHTPPPPAWNPYRQLLQAGLAHIAAVRAECSGFEEIAVNRPLVRNLVPA